MTDTNDDRLENGYGVDTPPGDNYCNDYAQRLADGYLGLTAARGDIAVEDAEFALMLGDSGSPSMFGNIAVSRRPLSEREWAGAIERMHHLYGERDGGPFLVFSPWPTGDLTKHGMELVGHPPLMLRPAAPPGPAPAIPGFEIRPVDDDEAALHWETALSSGFGEPALPGRFLPPLARTAPGWRFWNGYLGGAPVGCAAAHTAGTHVDVAFIACIESARGRGIGAALTMIAAQAQPDLPAMLIASDLGRPVYERLGFRALMRYTLWIGHR